MMTRGALVVTMAMLVSGGIAPQAQDPVTVAPASPVRGGKVMKSKAMTAVGTVKSATADSLTLEDGSGKEWTFVVGTSTKIVAKPHAEPVHVAPASPIEGGTVKPGTPRSGQEGVDVVPDSPIDGGKVIQGKTRAITDLKDGQRVQVTYHDVDGKMHATQIRVM